MSTITRQINRAKRQAAERPVTLTVQVRREHWTAHRAMILEELAKLGMVIAEVAELDGLAAELAKRGRTLEPL